ncbi:Hypothetical predicted protein [Mytilus galloprovincialis]|uniref:Uncharacterized protein n=1 Tax=Mytilus galloprovincialis TaxID=29158 RepID=A0A8B6FCD7_MYTGA|nr:Hypothetical predicted protein [Mytilus galloprovincialis]
MNSSMGLLMLVVVFIANNKNIVNACTTDEFECANRNCIDKRYRCDDSFECILPDTSDEENCTVIQACPEGTYKCETGECVNNRTECPIVIPVVLLSSTIAVDIQSSFVSPTTNSKLISATSHYNTNTLLSSGLSSTVIHNLQSSSAFIPSTVSIEPTTTHHSYQTSVIQTTLTSPVKTPPTDDQTPDEESNKLLYLLFLLILLVLLIVVVVWRYRIKMRSMIYKVTGRGTHYHDASRNREMH